MIVLNNISKQYPTAHGVISALQNISLNVDSGEIFGIIGKSGAGKSTLIRCVNLLEKPTAGTVIVDQQELTALPTTELRNARRKIGMIFQHFNLLNSRTAYENIALPLELSGVNQKAIAQKVNPLLELTHLTDQKNQYPAQLSGGQKQRVAIARALASNPTVLLSDEATSALDPETTQAILDLLINIRDTLNITILLITHEMSVIKACCDRVGILQEGKLIEENEAGEFFAHPKTQTAKNFITSSIPHQLPAAIQQYVLPHSAPSTHPLLRVWFSGGTATQPIMTKMIGDFHLRINILQAHVEYIKNHTLGIMILAIKGDQNQLNASIAYLKSLKIQAEVMGYVPDHVISFI